MPTSDKQEILEKVLNLHTLFHQGKIPTLTQHEVHPNLPNNSRENYLYFTLPPCLNFQRSSPSMWASALKSFNDPETNYLFCPEEVVKQTREKIQRDLTKHNLALQKNKHTDIWIAICNTLNKFYDNNLKKLLEENNWDVVKIHNIIQKEKRKDFPYLSGPKMSNYWLYILSQYTDTKFNNMHEISIIPDTHVLQCSVQLGITPTLATPIIVAKAWKELLNGSKLSPVEMHPVLWNWSRNNFKPEV